MPVRVLIAEDVAMVRGALTTLLNLEADMEVVASVESGDEVLGAVSDHLPDVAILDIDLPGRDGLSLADEIGRLSHPVRVVILTSLAKPGTFRRAMAARVSGFILKQAMPEYLIEAVREVHAGRRAIDPALAIAAWETADCPLTTRELEVLRKAADGLRSKEIAQAMYLSIGTVRNYLASANIKLNARTRLDAIRIARDADWL